MKGLSKKAIYITHDTDNAMVKRGISGPIEDQWGWKETLLCSMQYADGILLHCILETYKI